MSKLFETIKLEKQQVMHEQVYEKLLHLLQSGQLQSGEKILGAQKLAKVLHTHSATVHLALQKLTREGWLNRIPKKGTYVSKREEKLTCVGVYGDCGTTNAQNSPYVHAVRQALREELEKDGIEMDLWMDSRASDQNFGPWKSLIKAAEQRQFQAVIVTDTNGRLEDWLCKLPIPAAFQGAPRSMQNNVDHDMRQFVEISLQELARQGCRSVGFISPLLDASEVAKNPKGASMVAFDMLEHFTDVARELGLIVKNEWMRVAYDRQHLKAREQEHFGYEQFLKLWSQPEKPEGLLVFTDVVARGMLMAIQEKQVRVPDELKLVVHKNESIDLFCPVPATFVVSSEREAARALIEQVQKQFRGESCERISLPFKLVAHINP